MSWCPRGVREAADILSRSTGTFLVYFDPDVDGLFSGRFGCMLCDALGIPYETYINENRQHGFFYEDIASLRERTVVAVDFSITADKLELLRQNRVRLINIDHHDIQNDSLVTYSFDGEDDIISGVVINNQYSFEPEEERYLSGAGVVYYTLCNMLQGFDTETNRALVGLTLLSDIRPLENPDAEMFLRTCFTTREPYINYLVDVVKADRDYTFGVPRMERNYVDYTFSPRINALFRLNMGQVAMDIAFGKRPSFSLDQARDIQNQIRDYVMEHVTSPFSSDNFVVGQNGVVNRYGQKEFESLNVFYMQDESISDSYKLSNFIGLACSGLKGYGQSCIVYIGSEDFIVRGSFRGRFDSIPYLDIFQRHGVEHCAGHQIAFGFNNQDLSSVDWAGLNAELKVLEAQAEQAEYTNRILDVDNLSMFLHSDALKQMAISNTYVRDSKRTYIHYTGHNASRRVNGKMIEWMIDGVSIKCFDDDIDEKTGYILPIYERNALVFFLKNIKK